MIYTTENVITTSELQYNIGEKSYLTDAEYDFLFVHEKSVKDPERTLTHVPLLDNAKLIETPYWMGSVETFFEGDTKLDKWLSKIEGNIHITPKLDGASVMYWNDGKKMRLANRGKRQDICQDITDLLDYMKLPYMPEGFVFRCELVMNKVSFEEIKSRYDYTANRNMIAGLIRHFSTNIYAEKKYIDIAEFVDMVIFEVIIEGKVYGLHNIPYNLLPTIQSTQMKLVPTYPVDVQGITEEYLNIVTQHFHSYYEYPIDGIVLYLDSYETPNTKNCPDYCRAYKETINVESAIVTVTSIQWGQGIKGQLTPTLHFDSVRLCDADVSSVSAHNAKTMMINKIGIGSRIKIIRSGGIIPKIIEIIESTAFEMPDIQCHWDKYGTHLISDTRSQNTIITEMCHFAISIGAKGVGESCITEMYRIGCRTIHDMFRLTKEDLIALGPTRSGTVINTLHKALHSASLIAIMIGSGMFPRGIGQERLKLVLSEYPRFDFNRYNIQSIPGFGDKTISWLIKGRDAFISFIEAGDVIRDRVNFLLSNAEVSKSSSTSLENSRECVTFTGFRDKELVEEITTRGMGYKPKITKDTTILVTANQQIENKSTIKARNLGILVMDRDLFVSTYID